MGEESEWVFSSDWAYTVREQYNQVKNWEHKDIFKQSFYVHPGLSHINTREQLKIKKERQNQLENTLKRLLI